MKHLHVLEQAGLVVARKRGREKLHIKTLSGSQSRIPSDSWRLWIQSWRRLH